MTKIDPPRGTIPPPSPARETEHVAELGWWCGCDACRGRRTCALAHEIAEAAGGVVSGFLPKPPPPTLVDPGWREAAADRLDDFCGLNPTALGANPDGTFTETAFVPTPWWRNNAQPKTRDPATVVDIAAARRRAMPAADSERPLFLGDFGGGLPQLPPSPKHLVWVVFWGCWLLLALVAWWAVQS